MQYTYDVFECLVFYTTPTLLVSSRQAQLWGGVVGPSPLCRTRPLVLLCAQSMVGSRGSEANKDRKQTFSCK